MPEEPGELVRTRCFLLGDHEDDADATILQAPLAEIVHGASGR